VSRRGASAVASLCLSVSPVRAFTAAQAASGKGFLTMFPFLYFYHISPDHITSPVAICFLLRPHSRHLLPGENQIVTASASRRKKNGM
jgi:hypothetical protein